jgi:glucose/arabinose dehydrogenase
MRVFSDRPNLPSRVLIACVAICGLGFTGCDNNGGDPKNQIGANPVLPEPQQYLLPPIHIARIANWGQGEKPTVPQGLQVRALATDLQHPRSVYALPNGDVLVVETSGPKAPINRPKDLIMGWVQSFAGARAQGGNRITLLRGVDGDGKPELRTVFLDHLNAPSGWSPCRSGRSLGAAN